MDKAKRQKVIDEKKQKLFPISNKLARLMDEEKQKRLKEIKRLLSKERHLRHEIETLERIAN